MLSENEAKTSDDRLHHSSSMLADGPNYKHKNLSAMFLFRSDLLIFYFIFTFASISY